MSFEALGQEGFLRKALERITQGEVPDLVDALPEALRLLDRAKELGATPAYKQLVDSPAFRMAAALITMSQLVEGSRPEEEKQRDMALVVVSLTMACLET